MMFKGIRRKSPHQAGSSLVELIIAIGITGILAAGAGSVTYQIWASNARDTAHLMAVKKVENALHYMIRDVQMAQEVQTDNLSPDEVLRLIWVAWDNTQNQASYYLSQGELSRQYASNNQTAIANWIASLDIVRDLDGKVTITITSNINGMMPASETRVIEVAPRPAN